MRPPVTSNFENIHRPADLVHDDAPVPVLPARSTTSHKQHGDAIVSSERESPPRSPRLAIIRQKYRPDGGAERFTGRLIATLRESRYDVTLITRRWDATAPVHCLTCNPPRFGRIVRDWGFARAVCKMVRQHDFDLVQSNERIPCCDVYRAGDGVHRAWLQHRRRTQSLLERCWTAISPYHAYVRGAEKQVFESSRLRAVICNSHMVRNEILRYFAIDPAKLKVIYSGVDTQKFSPALRQHRPSVRSRLEISDEATVFLFVGSGFERKGLRAALHGLAEIPDAYMIVAGDDKRSLRFVREAANLGLGRRVHFLGVCQDVGPLYGAADALVLPTLYDPFPNVVLEAMASGLPVVVSTTCGAAEIIEEGKSGFVCDALDRNALVQAMRQLTRREVRESMAIAARQRVEPLTLEAMLDKLAALYRELLQ